MICEVIVDVLSGNVNKVYDYIVPEDITVECGSRVHIPFGNRRLEGFVVGIKKNDEATCPIEKLKSIYSVIDTKPVLSKEILDLMWFMSKEFHILLADALRFFIPSEMRGDRISQKLALSVSLSNNYLQLIENSKKLSDVQNSIVEYLKAVNMPIRKTQLVSKFSISPINTLVKKGILVSEYEQVKRTPYQKLVSSKQEFFNLTEEQQNAVKKIGVPFEKNKKFLIHGVTGCGKTEIYLNTILNCLENEKTAIMLVPEISLTPQMLNVLKSRFGDDVAILHSGLSSGERFDEWWRLRTGDAKIAIGARSAIFAPLENVGVIIIDEEHDSSYIADNGKYVTSKIAEFRSKFNNCALILGSATPSVETYYKAKSGEFELITMKKRVNAKPLPQMKIVDMRKEVKSGNAGIFSAELKQQLEECLNSNNQAMLFINRRGFSSIVVCKECGYVAKCKDCDVSLTYHREENTLKCHYCSARYKMLDICPECKSEHIRQNGLGTEKVVYELNHLFPNAKVLRMDNDTTQNKEGHLKIVQAFSKGEADILVGTQMITKGHDFKNVALVGVLDADLSLYFSDYRSTERTYQLITQVAGRAGRADVEGNVVLQTYSPDHYIYSLAKNGDYNRFYEREIALRYATHYPPYSDILRVVVQGEDEEKVIEVLKNNYLNIQQLQKQFDDAFVYINKMKSPIKRIQKKFRYQILMRIQGKNKEMIKDKIFEICEEHKEKNITSYVEINPQNMQ